MAGTNRITAVINRLLSSAKSNRLLLSSASIGYFVELLRRVLSEIASASDALVKSISKSISDDASLSDAVEKSTGKTVSDDGLAAESIAKGVEKQASDSSSASESISKDSEKLVNDAASVSEAFSKVMGYNRYFSDSAAVTDDLDGEASPEDEQTISFFKVLSDFSPASDQINLQVSYNRNYSDSANADELISNNLNKVLFDSVNVAESIDYIISSGITNTDSSGVSDSATFGFGLVKAENPAAYELISISFSRSFSDTATPADSPVKSAGKILSDAADCADSGSLISQGYVDNNDYFAEDYVGASRTF